MRQLVLYRVFTKHAAKIKTVIFWTFLMDETLDDFREDASSRKYKAINVFRKETVLY